MKMPIGLARLYTIMLNDRPLKVERHGNIILIITETWEHVFILVPSEGKLV